MRWLPLLALLTGCYEYDLNPIGDTTNAGPEPGLGLLPSADDIGTDAGSTGGLDVGLIPTSVDIHTQLGNDFDEDPLGAAGVTGTSAGWNPNGAPVVDSYDDWWNEPWAEPPEDEEEDLEIGPARMTGGGQVTDAYGTVSPSITLHCANTFDNHQLDIHLEDGSIFRLGDVDWVSCIDDPNVESSQPERTFDTVVGVAWGDVDGEPADIWFRFVDGGEPSYRDTLWFQIYVGNDVIEAAGRLGEGNLQTHDPVGN